MCAETVIRSKWTAGVGDATTRPGLRLPISVFEGHLIVDFDGRKALVDTGCPVTLGRGELLSIGGRDFELHDNFHGITVKSVAEPVGYPFEILVGMDVLGEFITSFSLRNAELILNESIESEGEVLDLDIWFGVPTIPIVVGGVLHRVIFDTGAPTSYLSAKYVEEFEFVGTRKDFFPLKGSFESKIYRVPVNVGKKTRFFELAAMKGALASMLEPSDMPGILGTELLSVADVTLSMATQSMVVSWHEEP